MALSSEQLKLIKTVDEKVCALLAVHANDETLLVSMVSYMPSIKSEILDKLSKQELELYCYEYKGFYQFMKTLENLAQSIANGDVKV